MADEDISQGSFNKSIEKYVPTIKSKLIGSLKIV